MTDRFAGATSVVTGAGSGIGRAVAQRMVAEGARVVVVDLLEDRVADVVAELGSRATGVATDIAAGHAVDEIIAAAGARVDVLANVAGIMDGFLPVAEIDDETWNRVIEVNLSAAMRLTRAVLPLMQEAGRGSIVNVGSEASLKGGAAGAAYTASKHALIGLTRHTAVFYGQMGIRCNAVCPGGVMTNIDATSRSEFGMSVVSRHLSSMMSVATAEEVAGAVCWLASDDSANVNGAVLTTDGGWSAV